MEANDVASASPFAGAVAVSRQAPLRLVARSVQIARRLAPLPVNVRLTVQTLRVVDFHVSGWLWSVFAASFAVLPRLSRLGGLALSVCA